MFFALIFLALSALQLVSGTANLYGYFVSDLSSTTNTLFQREAETWQASGLQVAGQNVTPCSPVSFLLGGNNILNYGGYFTKTYDNLPTHDIVYFYMLLPIFDQWAANDHFTIYFDDQVIASTWAFTVPYTFPANQCGSSLLDLVYFSPIGKIYHNATSLTLKIVSQVNSINKSFGLRDVYLIFAQATSGDNGTPNNCGAYTVDFWTQTLYGSPNYYCGRTSGLAPGGANCNAACKQCYGTTAAQCFACADNYGYDGTSCVKCASGCSDCVGPAVTDCVKCQAGYWHFWNNTCLPTCDSSMYYDEETIQNDCKTLCYQNNSLSYWTDECTDSCPHGLQETTLNGVRICNYQCNSTAFLYSDGTCNSVCALPMESVLFKEKSLCQPKCSGTTPVYYPSDQNCYATCPAPLVTTTISGLPSCLSPCTISTYFLYSTGTCKASCPSGRRTSTSANIKFCLDACLLGYYFHTFDSSCKSDCNAPLQKSGTSPNLQCIYPCTSTQILNQNGLCSEKCDPPFTLSARSEGFNICNPPCQSNTDFYYPSDQTCKASCGYPNSIVNVQGVNFCTVQVSQEAAKQVQQMNQISSTGGTATSAGAVLASILNSGDPGSLGASSLAKLLQYMKFLNINYPPKLLLSLTQRKVVPAGITFSPEIDDRVKDAFPQRPLPEKFEEANIHSSFFVNIWKMTISLAIVLAVIGIAIILGYLAQNSAKLRTIMQKILVAVKWNFLLTVFCSNFGDVGLYTALELNTLTFDSVCSVLSFLFCIFLNICVIFVLYRSIQITKNLYSIKKRSATNIQERKIKSLHKKWENYQMLFQGFHNISILQQMFTFNLIVRAYVINIIVGLLYDYPLVQIILLTIMSCCMVAYLCIKMPMLDRINNIQQIVFELIILIVNVCALAICIMDIAEIEDYDTRELLGAIIMDTNVAISVATPTFLAVKLVVMAREMYLARKASKQLQILQGNKRSKRNFLEQPSPNLRVVPPRTLEVPRKIKRPERARVNKSKAIETANTTNFTTYQGTSGDQLNKKRSRS